MNRLDAHPPSPMTQDDTFAPGTRIGNYEVLSRLGKGGMGVVYLVQQVFLRKRFALKVLNAELALMPEFVQVFRHEAQTLASLHHPHIVQVHDFGELDGRSYFVMDYVDGGTVEDLRRMQGGKLKPADALGLMRSLSAGLDYAHRLGVVHRDLKPENFLLDRDGVVKITDFGLAKFSRLPSHTLFAKKRGDTFMHFARAAEAAPELTGGTEGFMAPELRQAGGSGGDARSDVYAMGVIAYQLLTGVLPPEGAPEVAALIPGIDPRWDRVLARSLAHSPGARYAAAGELGRALDELADSPNAANAPLPSWLWALPVPVLSVVVFSSLILFNSGAAPAPAIAAAPVPELRVPAAAVETTADGVPERLKNPRVSLLNPADAELGYGLALRGNPTRIEGWRHGSRAVWSHALPAGRYRVSAVYANMPVLGSAPVRLQVRAGTGSFSCYLTVSSDSPRLSPVKLGEMVLADRAESVEVELPQGTKEGNSLRLGPVFLEPIL